MASMTTYVDHVEIQKSIGKVQTYTDDNKKTENKIIESLDELKNSITINGKNISNKGEIVNSSMRNFETTTNSCVAVLHHVIDMYFKAHDNSASLVGKEGSKL